MISEGENKLILYNIIGHTRMILCHKYIVCRYCWKVGLYWQGIVHDISKFSFTESSVGVKYYTGKCSPNSIQKSREGYSSAWLYHKNRNKHHNEYWLDYSEKMFVEKNEKITPIEMPNKYLVEMFCDRIAACKIYKGHSYSNSDPLEYFVSQKSRLLMHSNTMQKLEELLMCLALQDEKNAFQLARKLLKEQ